jgi:hypothetical protein
VPLGSQLSFVLILRSCDKTPATDNKTPLFDRENDDSNRRPINIVLLRIGFLVPIESSTATLARDLVNRYVVLPLKANFFR